MSLLVGNIIAVPALALEAVRNVMADLDPDDLVPNSDRTPSPRSGALPVPGDRASLPISARHFRQSVRVPASERDSTSPACRSLEVVTVPVLILGLSLIATVFGLPLGS